MYENNRRHYRVAQRDIYEDPCEGVYITKDEYQKHLVITAGLIFLSFLSMLAIVLKRTN